MATVSVVLPCLNEEAALASVIDRIREVFAKYGIKGEIIVVDNGSTDGSSGIALEKNVILVREPKKGYGNAYRAGFGIAKGDIIVMGDADGTYDFAYIPGMIRALRHADFVIGHRKYIQKNAMPWLHRYIGNPLFSALLRTFFHLRISDSHCGFGAIKRQALEKLELRSAGMEFASEILIQAKRKRLRITELPIIYHPRAGVSKLRSFRDGMRHLMLIASEFMKQSV